jgi:hypothetical protein
VNKPDYHSLNHGHPTNITITTPAPANNFSWAVPLRTRFMPLGLTFTFTADANVANREINIAYSMAPFLGIVFQLHRAVVANQGLTISLMTGNSSYLTADRNDRIVTTLPYPIILSGSQQIGSQTANIQAGDQYSSITLHGWEWIDSIY